MPTIPCYLLKEQVYVLLNGANTRLVALGKLTSDPNAALRNAARAEQDVIRKAITELQLALDRP